MSATGRHYHGGVSYEQIRRIEADPNPGPSIVRHYLDAIAAALAERESFLPEGRRLAHFENLKILARQR